MTDEVCLQVRRLIAERGLAACADDDAVCKHLLNCEPCWASLPAELKPPPPETGTVLENSKAPADAKDELAPDAFARSVRVRGGRLVSVLVGGAAALIFVVSGWAVFTTHRTAQRSALSPPETTEEETPEWLDDGEAAHGQRHRDDEGQMGRRDTRNRFGIEGPQNNEDPHMGREEARRLASKAGIVGNLHMPKASNGSWQAKGAPAPAAEPPASPYGRDTQLGNDPMSSLGALMGDQIGSNFGFGGLGLRGTGRGGGGAGEGTIGLGNIGTIGHGAGDRASDRPKWQRAADKTKEERPASAPTSMVDDELAAVLRTRAAARRSAKATFQLDEDASSTASAALPPPPQPTNAAEALLARYSMIEGVRFIAPSGYFANTYVPGDPELRVLQSRLRGYDRDALLPESVRSARFDDGSQRNAQPFDPPSHAALAVYMSASERGITAARRMLVQVGLQATPRYSGRRPAMNIALVLDARAPLDSTSSANVRALLSAFAEARDLSDKMSLFAAGPGGGLVVAADAFRHGPLTVALQRMLTERTGASVSLPDALQRALQSVRGGDDASAPLGSSVVIVIAPHALGTELDQLETLAHESAVSGVPVSVFGAGAHADPQQLARLALAGQGNRRTIDAASDAAAAVDRELSAVARVVARAVRLRIRLAPGVRLVSVLGSRPLDEVHAERVREAESSIDQRLSRNLGIERDRGEDEEGVQIVIPSFYAGDSHTVLLDVVAEGPGQIADVTVRYKDLVQLGNGNARESLWLPNLELARGALQRNVLKNLIAYELAQKLDAAGDVLASGSYAGAPSSLREALALLDSIGTAVPELRGDRELEADRALTAEYLALVGQLERPGQREFAADSLHFASLLKLQPRPEWDARTE